MHPIRLGIPLLLIGLFVFYVLYLIIRKKSTKAVKKVLYPGLFFVGVWAIIYYLVLS